MLRIKPLLMRLFRRRPPAPEPAPEAAIAVTFVDALGHVAAMAKDRTALSDLQDQQLLVYTNALECVSQVTTAARDQLVGECRRRGMQVRFLTVGMPRA